MASAKAKSEITSEGSELLIKNVKVAEFNRELGKSRILEAVQGHIQDVGAVASSFELNFGLILA